MRIQLDVQNSRSDFVLDYETTDLFVAATADLKVRKSKASWTKAAKTGEIVRFPLAEEAEVVGRVVFGELSEGEDCQWVSESVAELDLKDGEFVIDASPFLSSDQFRQPEVHAGYQLFSVPAGRYRLRILTYLNSVNGSDRLRLISDDGYWAYFEATRRGTGAPEWVVDLAEDNDEDIPEDLVIDAMPERTLVDFVFQLTPANHSDTFSELRKDGSLDWHSRKPSAFPMGIRTHSIDDYLQQKKTLLEPLERAEWERSEREDAVHQTAQEAKKSEEENVASAFAEEVEWFREKQFDKLLPRVTPGLAEGFVDYCETQMQSFRDAGHQVDPLNALTDHGQKTRPAELELWESDSEFDPPILVDFEAAEPCEHRLELIWMFRDPEVTDIFDQTHKVTAELLLVETAHGWKIAGIQCSPLS